MSKPNDRMIATVRADIDGNINALEAVAPLELNRFLPLFQHLLHIFQDKAIRYATIEQAERLREMLPTQVDFVSRMAKQCEPDVGQQLIEQSLPTLITGTVKLCNTRARQSESGRGEFGRPTLAKLQQRNEQLLAEIAELRRGYADADDEPATEEEAA